MVFLPVVLDNRHLINGGCSAGLCSTTVNDANLPSCLLVYPAESDHNLFFSLLKHLKIFLLFAEEAIKVWDDVFEVMVIQCITLQFWNIVFV